MNKLNISTVFILAIGFFVGCHSNNPPAPPDGAASDDSAMPHDLASVDRVLTLDGALPDSGAAMDSSMPHDLALVDAALPLDTPLDSLSAVDSAMPHDLALPDAALPDGRSAVDSSMPHDLTLADAALPLDTPLDGLSAVDSAMPHDLALPDAALPDGSVFFAVDSGDSVQREAGDGLDSPPKPVIKPVPGKYAVRSDPASTNPDSGIDPINPLDKIGLWVVVNPTTNLAEIYFFADSDISGFFPITDGSFKYVHGHYYDGTVCPADGYQIDGTFDSPTEFHGSFISEYYCSVQNSGNYIATLVPEIDAGE